MHEATEEIFSIKMSKYPNCLKHFIHVIIKLHVSHMK
jgi:hypothetical protein